MTNTLELDLREGTVLDQRFLVQEVRKGGAMSILVVAEHLRLRQQVVLKLLLPELCEDPALVTRFLGEAHAAARLRSEHVIAVLDVSRLPSGVPYIVLEKLEGADLAEVLARRGSFSLGEALDYVLQALEALADAHRAGIVHRDLKPANLFLAHRPDGSSLVKVIDFGISKFLNPSRSRVELTHSGFLGSPAYASPEQVLNSAHVDARTDIWAIGVILYEFLSGTVPFKATNAYDLFSRITNEEPVPLFELCSVPREFVGVIDRCLQKDPAQRFGEVADLARAIAPWSRTLSARVSLRHILGADADREEITDGGTMRASECPSYLSIPSQPSSDGQLVASGVRRTIRVAVLALLAMLPLSAMVVLFHLRDRETELRSPTAASVSLAPLAHPALARETLPFADAGRVPQSDVASAVPSRQREARPPIRPRTVPIASGVAPSSSMSPGAASARPDDVAKVGNGANLPGLPKTPRMLDSENPFLP